MQYPLMLLAAPPRWSRALSAHRGGGQRWCPGWCLAGWVILRPAMALSPVGPAARRVKNMYKKKTRPRTQTLFRDVGSGLPVKGSWLTVN